MFTGVTVLLEKCLNSTEKIKPSLFSWKCCDIFQDSPFKGHLLATATVDYSENFSLKVLVLQSFSINLANVYLFKVNKRNTRKRCEICSKSTIKTPERFGSPWSQGVMNDFRPMFFLYPIKASGRGKEKEQRPEMNVIQLKSH